MKVWLSPAFNGPDRPNPQSIYFSPCSSATKHTGGDEVIINDVVGIKFISDFIFISTSRKFIVDEVEFLIVTDTWVEN